MCFFHVQLAGAVLIIVSAVVLAQSYVFGAFRLEIFIIVVGGIIFIVAFFGCCGAIKEIRCLLLTVRICTPILLFVSQELIVLLLL